MSKKITAKNVLNLRRQGWIPSPAKPDEEYESSELAAAVKALQEAHEIIERTDAAIRLLAFPRLRD